MQVVNSVGPILCIFLVLAPPARGDRDLDTLVNAIRNGGEEARIRALKELGDMGSRSKPAVPAILPFLRDEDAKVREAAARTLTRIGPGPEAIPSLVEAMRDEQTGWCAARALTAMGPAAIPALTRALHDSDANVRSNAVYALGEFGPAAEDCMPALIALFAKERAKGRAEIANTWSEIGSGARSAIPLLAESLRDRSLELRLAAARALWKIEGRPRSVVPALIAIVESSGKAEKVAGADKPEEESPDWEPAAYAAVLLGRIGPEARQAVPVLIEAMNAPDSTLCGCAIEALGEIGPDAKQAIPAIVEHLGGHSEAKTLPEPHGWTYAGTREVGTLAWIALGEMGPEAAVGLTPSLQHNDKQIRRQAAGALKRLGPHAAPALDALVASLRDPDEAVRQYAADALGGIGSAAQSALPALLKAAKDPSWRVRQAVVDALLLIAPKSPEVVAALIAALEDPDGTVQAHAVMSLGKLGAAARPAVTLMANLLRSEEDYVAGGTLRRLNDCVASVLGDLGPVAKEAVPALVEAAGARRRTNWRAIPAIGKIGPEAKAAVPFLLRNCTPEAAIAIAQIDPDNAEIIPILRRHWQSADRLEPKRGIYPDRSWCYVLGRFGPRARPALPALEELLSLPDWRCRMSSALTVLEIDPTHQRALDVCVGALQQRSDGFPEVGPVVMGDFLESDLERRLDALAVPLGPRVRAFVPTLCEILTNPGRSARISAAERLAAIGPEAEGAVPALIQALGSRDRAFSPGDDLRSKAAEALARIGPAAVPPLVKALKDEDALIRAGAGDALGRIGSRAASAVPELAEALEDERMIVRASAAMALGEMGPAAVPAVPVLARALRDEYSSVRRNAAEALGALGKAAQPATSAIADATRDEYLAVREAAQATLRKIGVRSVPQQ